MTLIFIIYMGCTYSLLNRISTISETDILSSARGGGEFTGIVLRVCICHPYHMNMWPCRSDKILREKHVELQIDWFKIASTRSLADHESKNKTSNLRMYTALGNLYQISTATKSWWFSIQNHWIWSMGWHMSVHMILWCGYSVLKTYLKLPGLR